MAKIVEVNNLNYQVGKKKILNGLSFCVEEGSVISVVGSNGCGKTTLLKLLAGILPSNNSIIFSYGYINTKKSLDDLKGIGCVFPNDFSYLFDDVYKELAFPLENLCYSVEEIKLTIKELVDYFDMSYLLDKKTVDLTIEESALVQILLALIHKPKLLIMDQAFLMMRSSFKNKVISRLFNFIRDNKMTLILATSNLEDILFTDYTYVLDNGEIVMEGKTQEILKEDVRLKKLGLELPFMVDLSLMLEFYEILDKVYLDMEELVKMLWN